MREAHDKDTEGAHWHAVDWNTKIAAAAGGMLLLAVCLSLYLSVCTTHAIYDRT
jgi:hypothetical protein